MREQEMRMRVLRFLKARMRNMIMPATVGIGLAVGGCIRSGALYEAQVPEDASPAHAGFPGPDLQPFQASDSQVPGLDQAAPGPDLAAVEPDGQILADSPLDLARDLLSDPVPVYGDGFGVDLRKLDAAESSAPDVAASPDEAVALDGAGIDLGKDLGTITTKYIAPQPDAAADSGTAVAMYTAQLPDAGAIRDGLAVRYMAVMPDA